MNLNSCMARCAIQALVLLTVVSWQTGACPAAEPQDWLPQNIESLVALYKQFHAAPELSFQEQKTAEKLGEELRQAGADVTLRVGKTGVVGVLKNGAGPTVMIRTDLDALPVTELTELPYASKVVTKDKKGNDVGVMHACGHDIHMTCLVGTARYLAANKPAWRGTVVFIGQPAEEIGAGALAMLQDGLFTKFPRPDYALALHVDSAARAGTVGYRAGYFLANVDSVDITVKGRGGHGAYPQRSIDPVVQAAHLIVDLQSVVSRETSPFEPAVITVGSIHGGTKHNIIGDTCHLQLTVRSYTPEVRKRLLDAIRRKALAAAVSAGAPEPSIEFSDATPATRNDERLVERLVPVFRRALGEENVAPTEMEMGGEDFSQYGLAGVPIFMFRLGSIDRDRFEAAVKSGQPLPSLHSPKYYPAPQETIGTGVRAMSAAILDLLPATSGR
jgi:amidohydrolase